MAAFLAGSARTNQHRDALSEPPEHPAAAEVTTEIARFRLESLTPSRIQGIRDDPSTVADAFAACRSELESALGDTFADVGDTSLAYIFSAVVAHRLAPPGDSVETTFPALLHEPKLNCGNYGILVHHLNERLTQTNAEDARLRFVGWDGEAVGNHQTLFIEGMDGDHPPIFLDPTAGIVALASFDEVASGTPIAGVRIASFVAHPSIEDFTLRVAKALQGGLFEPSNLLYFFDSHDRLISHFGDPEMWPTPAAGGWRERTR